MLLGCGEGRRRSRICVLVVEPPDLLLPRTTARTCMWAPALRLVAVPACQQVQQEATRLGTAGAADRRHKVVFGRTQTTRRRSPPAPAERRDECGARRVRRETEDARPHPVSQPDMLDTRRVLVCNFAP